MAAFDDPAVFGDEKQTKDALKSAFAKVKANGEIKFLYYEKLKVGDKELLALAVVDFAPDFESKLKKATTKAPLARGYCQLTAGGEIKFVADSGAPKLAALKKYMATVSGVKPVLALGEDEAPVVMHTAPAKPAASSAGKDAPQGSATGKPDAALLKRMAELNAQVKRLPGEAGDAFISQINRVAKLIQTGDAKDAQAATQLLDALEPMMDKQRARQAPQMDDAVLVQVNAAVDKAYKALPAQPPDLRADIEALAEAKAFAKVARDPAQAKQALVAAKPLIARIQEVGALAQAWPGVRERAKQEFDKALQAAREQAGPGGEARVNSHEKHPATVQVLQLCADPKAYAKAAELRDAMQQQADALKGLMEKIRRWTDTGRKAAQDIKDALKKVDASYQKKVNDAILKDATYDAWVKLAKRGQTEVLDTPPLELAARQVLDRIEAIADEEQRRIDAAALIPKLTAHRPAVVKAVDDCMAELARATAALPAVEASWRLPAVQADLANDAAAIGVMRTAAAKLRDDLDAAVAALGTEPPPAQAVISDADALLRTALPDLAAIAKRTTRNLAKTSPDGIMEQLDVMFADARTHHFLSNNRKGQLRAALRKAPKTRALAQADINAAIAEQQRPKPSEWFKVLQLQNARAGGDLRTAKVGDVTINGKRIPVHMTLYLANADLNNSPTLTMTPAAVINALLPDVVGSLGTHVTAEVNGQVSKTNPHYFKGAAAGVPNCLAGKPEWATVQADMLALLNQELARMTVLVTSFIANHGLWVGD